VSKALETLQQKLQDLDRLREIHERLTGRKPGRRGPEADVLNRSAIVLGVGAWEAYVEDVTAEAFDFLVKKAKSHNALPDGLKVHVSERLGRSKESKGAKPLALWRLAGDGFRLLAKDALQELLDGFHTPAAADCEELFRKGLGLKGVLSSRKKDRESLDDFITTRHRIAHGRNATVVQKIQVSKFRRCLEAVAETIDDHVADHVEKLLRDEVTQLEKERRKRPGRRPKKKPRRGRPPKQRPW